MNESDGYRKYATLPTSSAESPEVIDGKYGIDVPTTEAVDAASESRSELLRNLARLSPYTAQLPDDTANEVYDRVEHHERTVAPGLKLGDYDLGTATYDDELLVQRRRSGLLLSADHATNPVRKATNIREGADHGTAGIALSLAEEIPASVVLPLGRQSSNANVAEEHPLKDVITEMLPEKEGFLSVHGMIPGKFVHQFDPTEIHGVIGLGSEPSEQNHDIASDFVKDALDKYGLKVVIGNDIPFFADTALPYLPRDSGGKIQHAARLAAAGPGSTTNHVYRQTADRPIVSMQIEISRSLRLLPKELEYRDKRAKILGVYMGYLMTRELMAKIRDASRG